MRRKESLPELLAPAGDMDALIAAVSAGADAVYIGGKSFGARAFAKNFDIDGIRAAVSYTHLFGVKLYVTVNTLVFDKELSEVSGYLAELWEAGVDAVITADLGVIREARRRVPSLPIHASTQMSVHNTAGADAAFSLGCERVVLARELSLENIISAVNGSRAEIEIFLHGALCVCHSGQCLMSSLVGGRSGNRGECAQPCRLPYNGGKYPLSLSDLSLASHIRELISSGVSSLKIEGRMKSPEYVYTVTSIYRKLLDEGRDANEGEKELLRCAFSRGGFTDGYFRADKFSSMTGVRSDSDKEASREMGDVRIPERRLSVSAEVEMRLGKPSVMILKSGNRQVCVKGAVPTAAISSPLTEAGVKERLSKMGGTPLTLDPCSIALVLDGGINLPPSAINSLRREAVAALMNFSRERTACPPYKRAVRHGNEKKRRTALFLNPDVLSSVGEEDLAYFDTVFTPLESFMRGTAGVYIPPVIFDSETDTVKKLLRQAVERGCTHALVGNIGAIALAKEAGLLPIGDFRLNVTNSEAAETYRELGISDIILSPELTLPQARDIGGGVITYGRIPLMLTERCFIKENFGCERCNKASLSDRTGKAFPLMREFGHRNLIMNALVTYMGDRAAEIRQSRISHEHFIFSDEGAKSISGRICKYKNGEPLGTEVRRMGKR